MRFGQQRNLHLGRPRVGVVQPVLGDDLGLLAIDDLGHGFPSLRHRTRLRDSLRGARQRCARYGHVRSQGTVNAVRSGTAGAMPGTQVGVGAWFAAGSSR